MQVQGFATKNRTRAWTEPVKILVKINAIALRQVGYQLKKMPPKRHPWRRLKNNILNQTIWFLRFCYLSR